jgi:hypothetical protein
MRYARALFSLLLFFLLPTPGPAGAAEDSPREKVRQLVRSLLAAEGKEVKSLSKSLEKLGLVAVPPLLSALEDAQNDGEKRIREVLADLEGEEESFPLPKTLLDPKTRRSFQVENSDRLLFPGVSDCGRRICLAFKPAGDEKPPVVALLDRGEGRVLLLLDGEEPRLSGDGKTLLYLRPRGDDLHFYKTFYTLETVAYSPDARAGFQLDPDSSDNHSRLTLSRDGRRAAFQARLTCTVRPVRRGAAAELEVEGNFPALSPDGAWVAWWDPESRVQLRGLGEKASRSFGPIPPEQEVRAIRCLSRSGGVVFLQGPVKKPDTAFLWGFRPKTGAWGRLAGASRGGDLCAGDNGFILWRGPGLNVRRGLGAKSERVATRADAAGLSPGGHFAVYTRARKVCVVFLGAAD